MTIGQRIMQIRISCGLSQEEFGEKLDTSRQTISKWELDLMLPSIEKIVKISKLFSVSTDSILVDGISTFDKKEERYSCGVYKSNSLEIIETERVALLYYSNFEKTVFGVKAYIGFQDKKKLQAICEYRADSEKTEYAYIIDSGTVLSNGDFLKGMIGEKYDTTLKNRLYRSETFFVSCKNNLPTVSAEGIKRCLLQWRMTTSFYATASRFHISISTDKTEYAFDIAPKDTNVYCAISYNKVTEFGLLSGNQFFRIRNYQDNTEKFCRSYCNLGHMSKDIIIPTAECIGGKCVNTSVGLFFGIKRYTDDEIILCGCGGDEYRYSRTDKKLEILCWT